jgi:hypothetical protein
MADTLFVVAGAVMILGISLHFSLHRVEEGHVGVYYRVSSFLNSFHILTSNNTVIAFE